MERTETRTENWIYRCYRKRCPGVLRIEHTSRQNYYRHDEDYLWIELGQRQYGHFNYPAAPACPVCGGEMRGQPIRGTTRPDIPCNARCTGAVGSSCDCACGGANHGAAHA